MSYQDILNDLRSHVISKPVFAEGLRHLDAGQEIRILIDGQFESALFWDARQVQLEGRAANKPDVEFSFQLNSLPTLKALPEDDLAEFGIGIVKQIIAGNVRVRVCGSVWNVLTKGYLGIIKAAGPDFLKFLSQHGLSGIAKISSLIRNMKKKT
ncbi:MAG: hypothetical protein KDD22_05035 [Bdellovibrionales bacterium]|nr:hypothetical protein [Bdellovibrionales bacterium]